MAVSEELIVRIRGDLSDVQAKLGQLDSRVNRSASNAQSRFQAMGRAVTAAFAGIATIAAARGFASIVSSSLQASEAIQDMADRANVGTEFLQEMRDVANQTGASARDFDDAISRLNRRLGLFIQNGGGPAAQAFQDLGLSSRIASGELQDAEGVFYAIAAAIQEVGTQAERSALLSQVFGEDAGPRLLSMLSLGTEGINRAAQAARDGGRVIASELVTQASDASDALERMQDQFSARVNSAIAENADQLVQVGDALATIAGTAIAATARVVEFLGALNDLPAFGEQSSGLNSIIDDIAAGNLRNRTGIRTRLRSTLGREGGDRFFDMVRDFPTESGGRSELFTEESLGRIIALMGDVAQGRERMAQMNAQLADSETRVTVEINRTSEALSSLSGPADTASQAFDGFLDRMEDAVSDTREFNDFLERMQTVIENLPANIATFEHDNKAKLDALAEAAADAGAQFDRFALTIENAAEGASGAIGDSFVRMAQGIRVTFEDLARDLVAIMARLAFSNLISAPLSNLFAGGVNGLSSAATGVPKIAGSAISAAGAPIINNIDARGAAPGVEDKIREVLRQEAPSIQRSAAGLAVSTIASLNSKRSIR